MNLPVRATTRVIVLSGLLLAASSVLLVTRGQVQLDQIDRLVYDTFLRNFTSLHASEEVVVVDVDEQSLAAVGQWPWPRDQLASIIHTIADGSPAAIGIDFLFAEPDRTSPAHISEQLWKDFNVRIDTSSLPMAYLDNDYAFSLALQRNNTILGIMFFFHHGQTHAPKLDPAGSLKIVYIDRNGGKRKDTMHKAVDMVRTLPMFMMSASGVGFVNVQPDMDGIIRKAPLLISYEGEVYPSLALAAYMQQQRQETVIVTRYHEGIAEIRVGKKTIPTDSLGSIAVRFAGPRGTYRSISAADILDGKVEPSEFTDKIVFLGASAEGLKDIKSTPFDRNFPGVEVHASVAGTLLGNNFIEMHQWSTTERVLTALLTTIFALAISLRLPAWITAVTMLTFLLFIPAISISLFLGSRLFFSPVMPMVTYLISFSILALIRFRSDELQEAKYGQQLMNAQSSAIVRLASLVEARDLETGNHILRTQRYIKILAEYLQKHGSTSYRMTDDEIDLMVKTSALHDIGKVGVPDSILLKPASLTSDEYEVMKRHTVYGAKVLQKARSESEKDTEQFSYLKIAEEIALAHHEKWDGSGYPYGLAGEQIPLSGRLMAVADVYDALISERVYKKNMTHTEAIAQIMSGGGSHFDPVVVNAFRYSDAAFLEVAIDLKDEEGQQIAA